MRLLKKLPNGTARGEQPFMQPTKFTCLSKALGIEIPLTLVVTADEVIE